MTVGYEMSLYTKDFQHADSISISSPCHPCTGWRRPAYMRIWIPLQSGIFLADCGFVACVYQKGLGAQTVSHCCFSPQSADVFIGWTACKRRLCGTKPASSRLLCRSACFFACPTVPVCPLVESCLSEGACLPSRGKWKCLLL